MASNYDFINYKDFDIEKLNLCEGKENKNYGYRLLKIEYTYADGVARSLRLRSPVLFSYGIKKNKEKSNDYFMTLKSFYDELEMNEKEIAFRKTLDSISRFLREKVENINLGDKDYVLKRDCLGKMDITTDNGTFFPKLRERKTYENGKVTGSEITTVFYEKEKDGNLSERDPSFIEEKTCKAIVYMVIADIFVKNPILKIRTYLSNVIIIKTDVTPPINWVRTSNVIIGSDDEDDEEK